MKTRSRLPSLRLLSVLAAVGCAAWLPAATAAHASAQAKDDAATLLRRDGIVHVKQAGPHVGIGTFRIQVAVKLGQPDARLGDDTWLFHDRRIEGSDARGTLIVRFANGRVQSLALATPAVVASLRDHPQRSPRSQMMSGL